YRRCLFQKHYPSFCRRMPYMAVYSNYRIKHRAIQFARDCFVGRTPIGSQLTRLRQFSLHIHIYENFAQWCLGAMHIQFDVLFKDSSPSL
ncbi:hypothetical protein COCCADRAFT_82727, partial [Bipolaris zeicola 26-R-13]